MRTIHSGFWSLGQRFSSEITRFAAGYIGKIEKYKKIDRLLFVWEKDVERLDNALLHVFGTGSLQQWAEDFVASNRLKNNVILHGYERDLDIIFSSFPLLVTLSEEGQCFAVVEALGCWREVLLPSHGCFPELYGHFKAVHMVATDETYDMIADEIARVLAHEELLSKEVVDSCIRILQYTFFPSCVHKAIATGI